MAVRGPRGSQFGDWHERDPDRDGWLEIGIVRCPDGDMVAFEELAGGVADQAGFVPDDEIAPPTWGWWRWNVNENRDGVRLSDAPGPGPGNWRGALVRVRQL